MTNKTKQIAYTGVMTALVFLATFLLQIRVPFTNGYIHLGDSMVFVAGVLLGWKYGAFAAGAGSMLADIAGGFASWALPTLIIKTLMGALVGYAAHNKKKKTIIVVLSGIFTVIWVGFNTLLKNLLTTNVTSNSVALLEDIDGVETIQELLTLKDKVQTQLLVATIVIPLIIIIIALIIRKTSTSKIKFTYLLSFIVSGVWMVFGYYITYYVLTGNYISPIFSVPLNIIQFSIGFVLAELILLGLKRSKSLNI